MHAGYSVEAAVSAARIFESAGDTPAPTLGFAAAISQAGSTIYILPGIPEKLEIYLLQSLTPNDICIDFAFGFSENDGCRKHLACENTRESAFWPSHDLLKLAERDALLAALQTMERRRCNPEFPRKLRERLLAN